MIQAERILKEEEYIMRNNVVSMKELRETFAVSMNTLRADITELVRRGSVVKVYGGVHYIPQEEIPALEEREGKNQDIKHRLCQKVAEFIHEDDVIYIDAGSTVEHLIDYLDQDTPVTVLTSSLAVMQKASKRSQISLFNLPGKYHHPTGSFVSSEGVDAIKNYNIKTAFIAVSGVSDTGDFTATSYYDSELKKEVIRQSQQIIVLADSSKIGVAKLRTFAKLNQIDYFVTDSNISAQFVKLCETQDVSVLIVDVDQG